MQIRILCTGKLKERFYREAEGEFLKRLSRYGAFEVTELPDEKAPEKLSPAQAEQVKQAEGRRMLARISPEELVVAMDISGEQLPSPELAKRIQGWLTGGRSRICFLIGGSLGLSPEALARADCRISFGKPTFSHQIFRIMLLEQLYRSFRIINGEPYHK